ncbi:MAG: hypothetical protein A2W05_00965 [Candidatus Schekmanbacteria bacterium RBG_16_38_10]|uniref:Uncharacterized protein n=1 Tax=Candidatus Schekmanbacteria bacterium RBG_16_38_10 TaxID=1817879 RepID=A0A1F7S0Z0_9BACT|nr:MAG: hypothetical protein A2W05_00965 [Candidatus Schekmanbacteria bacterium RBG_16_38_10]
MNTLQMVIFGVVILGSLAGLWLATRNVKRKRRLPFQDRPDMSEEEFFVTYYRDASITKETICHVLKVVANATEIPATKIRPSDRFDRELAPVRGWEFDDGLAEISWFAKSKMKKAGVREPTQLHTVDDLIRYVALLEIQKGKKRGSGLHP